jgi:hypothetical protein
MEKLFERFIEEEFDSIYEDSDVVNWLLDTLDDEITEDMFYDNFDELKEIVTEDVSNDEWLIQQIHERMDDMLIEALRSLLNK